MKTSAVVNNWIHAFVSLLLSSLLVSTARAWVTDGQAVWPDGQVTMTLRLGEVSAYASGFNPNTVGASAVQLWNPYMRRLQLAVSVGAAGKGTQGNGVNEVYFSSSYQGTAFQSSVLAITLTRTSGAVRVESDIVVNQSAVWGTYSGPYQVSSVDLGRVLAHEAGHVLGLGHPDESSQAFGALMNSHVGNVYFPEADDIEGAATLYGMVPGHEPELPTIQGVTADVSVEQKLPFELRVVVNARSSYTYQWFKDGAAIAGATSTSYKVAAAALSDAGHYYLELRALAGVVKSAVLTVTVIPRVAPTAKLVNPRLASFYVSEAAQFSVLTTGSSPMTYQWQKDGVNLPGETGSTFKFVANSLADAGAYRVIVNNDVGSATSEATNVVVKDVQAPVFSASLPTSVELVQGTAGAFYAITDSPVAEQWQWFKDGVKLDRTSNGIYFPGALSDAGKYTVKSTNLAGTSSYDFTVTILPPYPFFAFSLEPRLNTVIAGSRVAYSAMTSYAYTSTYQWFKDGGALAGQTGSTLVISSATAADAGDYYVVVRNAGGITTSLSATLKVQASATVSPSPAVRVVSYGGIVYYLQGNAALLQRHDLATGRDLDAVPLPGAGTQFCVGAGGVFFASSAGVVWRCPLEGAVFVPFLSRSPSVAGLTTYVDNLFVVAQGGSSLERVSIASKTVVATAGYSGQTANVELQVSERNSRVYVVGGSGGSYNIGSVYAVSESGLSLVATAGNSFPSPRLWLDRPESAVIDSSGMTSSPLTLQRKGALGLACESLASIADGRLLVLSGARIYLLNTDFAPVKSLAAPSGTVALFAAGTGCVLLRQEASGLSFADLDFAAFASDVPATTVAEVAGQALLPDEVFIDRDGLLWTMTRTLRSLVAWSPETRRLVAALRLRGPANLAAYSPVSHCVYLSYADHMVTVIDFSKDSPVETLFCWAAQDVRALNTAGNYVIMQQGSSDISTLVYNSQGSVVSVSQGLFRSAQTAWEAATGRVYGLRDNVAPDDPVSFVLSAGGAILSPSTVYDNGGIYGEYPIRLGASGTFLLGNGRLYDGASLSVLKRLPYKHQDAVWSNGSWVTLRDTFDGALLRRWDPTSSTVVKTALAPGRAKRLFALSGNRLLVLTDRYGSPRYTILDADLNIISTSGPTLPSRLANISVQADAGQGMDALVPGFVINGTTPKTLLLRGCGPGLAAFGVPGCLVDPTITLYNQPGAVLASNDNWGTSTALTELQERSADLYAFTLAKDSKDAVLQAKLAPGAYSAQVQGTNNGEGRALVEVYDAEESPGDSRAVNMSARCKISKDHQAIGGFVIQGDRAKKLLIRAVGPGLIKYSVTGTSADPKLRVFSGSTVIAENNDWSSDAAKATALKAAFLATGAFALDEGSKDAALLVELQPGNYTVYMESADGGSGVSILEFYEIE